MPPRKRSRSRARAQAPATAAKPPPLRLPPSLAAALAPLTAAPAALQHDGDRHVAIAVLGAALAVFVVAVAAGAATTRWQAGGAKYDGSLPLLWFDRLLRRLGPLLPAPLLAARAAAHGRLGGGGGGGRPARPGAHFVQAAAVYAAAALVRLSVYLSHRAGHLTAAWDAVTGLAGGGRAPAPSAAGAARALAARLVRVRSKDAAAARHLMSDHIFLGALLAALLAAEGALLVTDVKAHARGGGGRARRRRALLAGGAAACFLLYTVLAADMYFTAAYFHARHESAAAAAAGGVAFGAPVAYWVLRRAGGRT